MTRQLLIYISFLSFIYSEISFAQVTVLVPGDIMVLGVANNLDPCGMHIESEEISFVCSKAINTFTEIHITDNGWEAVNPGFWGNNEGTLELVRAGGNIPAGTVITIQGLENSGVWTWSSISPDAGFIITQINPGGVFNIEAGGDQFYFLQNGAWNPGAPGMASYTGDVIYGFNTLGSWSANGTTHQSNLHPDVSPCFFMNSNGSDFYKYTAPLTPAHILTWWHRVQDPANWINYVDCNAYWAAAPQYHLGASISFLPLTIGLSCDDCTGCPPFEGTLIFDFPPMFSFNVVYTDGTDTFNLGPIANGYMIPVDITDTTTYTLISVSENNGCLDLPISTPTTTFFAPSNNPGMHGEVFTCPNGSLISLGAFLGPHDPGGQWFPPLDPVFNMFYNPDWGPGRYYYVFLYDMLCPPDTASVDVFFIDTTGTIVEIGCDDNGTPNDISDDRMVVNLTMMGGGADSIYLATGLHLGVPYGVTTPDYGILGETTQFILAPGTATLTNMSMQINMINSSVACTYKIPLPPPGFCSDPCDHLMTATLEGDLTEICPNTCVDFPVEIFIDVFNNNDVFYEMDFSVSASGFPTWNFTGIEFTLETTFEICMGDVPTPVFDELAGTLTLPLALTGSEVSITLLEVRAGYDCTAILTQDEHLFTIYPLPPISTTSFAYCEGESHEVDLTYFDYLISDFYDVSWFDGNPYEGGSELNSPTAADFDLIDQLWAYVEDDHCGNSIEVPYIIMPQPDLDSVPPIHVCEGSPVVLSAITLTDLANTSPTYTFHYALPPDTSNQIKTPSFIPADTMTIYVWAKDSICYDTLPIEIIPELYPEIALEGLPCDLLNDVYSVQFTTDADSIHSNYGIVFNNPGGQDLVSGIPNDTNIWIEILNPSGLCKDTLFISAPNCNCPFISQPVPDQVTYSMCEDETIPVLTVNVGSGLVANWYTVPSGGVPLLVNSLTYQPPGAVSGNYFVEAYDPSIDCYSQRVQITFTVYPVALLQMLPDQVMCEPGSINFNTMIPGVLNGVPGAGLWYDLTSHQQVSGTIQPQNGNAWYYVFTSTNGSCESFDTIQATVHPMPQIDIHDILCDDTELTFDLHFTSTADVLLPSIGTLIQIPGTDSFVLENIPFDTDIMFNLQITATGCTNVFNQQAPNCSCPDLLEDDMERLCTDQANIDLSMFEGPGVMGSWEMVSTPAGSNPATLAGSQFDGTNGDVGLYVLRFIRDIILNNCVDTAFFEINLQESPFADAGNDAIICAPDQIILSGSAGGSNVQFTWQENGSGSITNPNALNTTYTPTQADIASGSISFTLTAVDQTGFCPSASETITVDINGSAYFTLSPSSVSYCDTSDIDVDFDALITFGSTDGEWFFPDTVSAPITGGSHFNPTTLAAGTYTIFYTSSNATPPCDPDTMAVSLIIENCACPSVALTTPVDPLCSDAATLNLNGFLITTEPGVWTIASAPAGSSPAVIVGSEFRTNNSDAGIYRLRFSLSNPVAGCPDFAEINLEVIATPQLQFSKVECADDLQSWEVTITTVAQNVTADGGTLISLGSNQYLINNITNNTNLVVTATNGNGLCSNDITVTAPDCACTIDISNLPGSVSLCPGDKMTLQAQVSGGKGSVTSFWVVANDSLYQTSLEVSQGGIYQFVTVDSLGCKDEEFVDVAIYQEMAPDAAVQDITCPGDQDGIIFVYDIQGGVGPYFISFNGGTAQPVNAFPHEITGLGAGNYSVELIDAVGCVYEFTLRVQSASTETINLGPDQTILVGDSVVIHPSLSFVPDSFYWQGDIGSIDPLQLDHVIFPDVDHSFRLFGIDDKGCIYSDDLFIRVLLESHITVPTIFSPNGDGLNDILAPNADPSVTQVEYFEIFSRWGELVYSERNFSPNGTTGWDGRMDGQKMMPGVFVYRLSAVNKRGSAIKLVGDVTLVR